MPILRMKEIRSMSPEEREQKLVELKAELARVLTMVKAGGSLENTMRIRELKRTIARILTVQNEERRKR
ncbi:50S ribosomal protein L29 [Candidatus Bathyarchaeota archaeon]|nr:50S ribosomal protein L29 [Candidatus Bathyarchaeota archaeon]PDM26633.1 MAG: 50S ribosomal protein L29 [Candidatus Bathyarchaeota archaeon B24-2]RJS83740.1 MAG: 50S ribosomal protein L29 [Candidatus Bathyarchaeota archaeon]RLG97091.1 MAG: 50S ribosomal protein L29 [Candidatus Bathyarchaeota archaeon]RLI23506.1 MAG: 50S ribosomal protein L29 [Candidatus Bathyarchaeota archaeon]